MSHRSKVMLHWGLPVAFLLTLIASPALWVLAKQAPSELAEYFAAMIGLGGTAVGVMAAQSAKHSAEAARAGVEEARLARLQSVRPSLHLEPLATRYEVHWEPKHTPQPIMGTVDGTEFSQVRLRIHNIGLGPAVKIKLTFMVGMISPQVLITERAPYLQDFGYRLEEENRLVYEPLTPKAGYASYSSRAIANNVTYPLEFCAAGSHRDIRLPDECIAMLHVLAAATAQYPLAPGQTVDVPVIVTARYRTAAGEEQTVGFSVMASIFAQFISRTAAPHGAVGTLAD